MRLEHEKAWEALALEEGLPLHIFRLGGEGVGGGWVLGVETGCWGGALKLP